MNTDNVQIFKTARRLLTGENSSYLLPEEMASLNVKRPLIVTDKGVKDAGIIQPVIDNLKSNGVENKVIPTSLAFSNSALCHSKGVWAHSYNLYKFYVFFPHIFKKK